VVGSVGPHPTLTGDQARACGELVERLWDNGRQRELIVIAPHGGDIERHTDEQAEQVASRLAAKAVSCWRCKGWKDGGGALVRWHITWTDLSAASFPRLDLVISGGFAHAVAFHGFQDPQVDTDVLVGGCAPEELKQEIAAEIDRATAGWACACASPSRRTTSAGTTSATSSTGWRPGAGAASRSSRVLGSRHGRRGRAGYRSLAVGRLREACLGPLELPHFNQRRAGQFVRFSAGNSSALAASQCQLLPVPAS
jgi:Poly-gamma-glutamate hydrolase